MPIERFEDLVAWQKARSLVAEIYKATRSGQFQKDFGLKDQIRRAAVSISSNIAEGFDRNRLTEFHQFLSIAKGSCAEVRSQSYVALDVGYLPQADFDRLLHQANEVSSIINALRASIERKLK